MVYVLQIVLVPIHKQLATLTATGCQLLQTDVLITPTQHPQPCCSQLAADATMEILTHTAN